MTSRDDLVEAAAKALYVHDHPTTVPWEAATETSWAATVVDAYREHARRGVEIVGPLVEADVLRRVQARIEARRNGMQGPREDSYDNPWNRGYVCGQKEAYEDALAVVADAGREAR